MAKFHACPRGNRGGGGGQSRIHVDTRSPESAKNILKYLQFHTICPRGQSMGEGVRKNSTDVHEGGGGGESKSGEELSTCICGWPNRSS